MRVALYAYFRIPNIHLTITILDDTVPLRSAGRSTAGNRGSRLAERDHDPGRRVALPPPGKFGRGDQFALQPRADG